MKRRELMHGMLAATGAGLVMAQGGGQGYTPTAEEQGFQDPITLSLWEGRPPYQRDGIADEPYEENSGRVHY